jgi:hypothetical protein
MMSKSKKEAPETTPEALTATPSPEVTVLSQSDLGWTDHVLSMLSDDEKIKGNPTTDGLRRIFEKALNCVVIGATTNIVQSPEPNNEKRATAIHSLTYVLLTNDLPEYAKTRSVDGSADVYWGNCDKVYRNHPVAVAETRAEGRALRRALKLRKVVAAEELAEDTEDHPDANSVNKITNNQINFIDVIAQRLNINVSKLLETKGMDHKNIYNMSHEDAVDTIRLLSKYQQNVSEIPTDTLGYNNEWK